jgi:hypothetical protein
MRAFITEQLDELPAGFDGMDLVEVEATIIDVAGRVALGRLEGAAFALNMTIAELLDAEGFDTSKEQEMPTKKRSAGRMPADLEQLNRDAVTYAKLVFGSTNLALGDFEQAAPKVMQALVNAYAEGYLKGTGR